MTACCSESDVCLLQAGSAKRCRTQVASWGGYTFIINLLPIHCLACIVTGQLTAKLYIAFAPLILIGTIEAGVRCWLICQRMHILASSCYHPVCCSNNCIPHDAMCCALCCGSR